MKKNKMIKKSAELITNIHKEEHIKNSMKVLDEFKKFALRGNMIDLAVGIIIGGAFNTIVQSLINDIIMPLLSIFTKDINFADRFISLNGITYDTLEAAKKASAPTLSYGLFISNILNFIIMAFVVFLMVKWINKLKKPEAPGPVTTKECPHCCSSINLNASKCPACTADLEA